MGFILFLISFLRLWLAFRRCLFFVSSYLIKREGEVNKKGLQFIGGTFYFTLLGLSKVSFYKNPIAIQWK